MDFILFIIIIMFQMAAADLKYRPAQHLHSVLVINFALGRVTACRETLSFL